MKEKQLFTPEIKNIVSMIIQTIDALEHMEAIYFNLGIKDRQTAILLDRGIELLAILNDSNKITVSVLNAISLYHFAIEQQKQSVATFFTPANITNAFNKKTEKAKDFFDNLYIN